MKTAPTTIERLAPEVIGSALDDLADLLADAVASGAAVSFVAPFDRSDARAFWQRTLGAPPPRAVVLVARCGPRIVGTVQAIPAWAPNQPHRAEIVKLLVHREHRGRGLGAALMRRVEEEARSEGFALLTLDSKRGSTAEALYHRLGWTLAGTIPAFALDPDGRGYHDAAVFYKALAGEVDRRR
jgi:GNAT superfamily N-acetyltransferase